MEKYKDKLINMAIEAATKSYSPYSSYRVGAAILGEDGIIYGGCNVENASYGGTICAERSAALKAVYSGAKEFRAIAIVGYHEGKKGRGESFAYPCGICRQFLREFSDESTKVYIVKNKEDVLETTLYNLLPNSFGPESLGK